MKLRPYVIAVVLGALWSVTGNSAAAAATVHTMLVCDLNGAMQAFNAVQKSMDAELPPTCQGTPYPVALEIIETIAGPAKDAEGDNVMVVRIGENVYTLAWPGFNTAALGSSI